MKQIFILYIFLINFLNANLLTINANQFESNELNSMTIFTGNVQVTLDRDKLNAQNVYLFFDNTTKSKRKVPLKYEATGDTNFEIFSKDKHYSGKGDKITYFTNNQEYVINGNAFVVDIYENRKIYGDVIYVNKLTGEAKVHGTEEKPVKFIIDINNKK